MRTQILFFCAVAFLACGEHEGHGDKGHEGHGDKEHEGHGDKEHEGHGDKGHEGHGDKGHEGRGDKGHEGHGNEGHEGHGDEGHEGHEPPDSVVVDPSAVKRSGIRTSIAKATALVGGIDVPAEIQADPDSDAHISSLVSGQIDSVRVSIGATVKKGETLAIIRSVALGEARAQAARASANVEVAKSNFARQEELQKEGIGAKRNFLAAQAELRRAQAELSAARRALQVYGKGSGSKVAIRSPINGTVVARHAAAGEIVSSDDKLFHITDISKVWAVGRVYQRDSGRIKSGADVVLTVQAQPDKRYPGSLTYVSPTLDEKTRTLSVRMLIDNKTKTLRPGLFGNLSITPIGNDGKAGVGVNADAIQTVEGKTVVFVPKKTPGEFEVRQVSVLSRSQGVVHLTKGLSAGESYVSSGSFVLKSALSSSEIGEGHAH